MQAKILAIDTSTENCSAALLCNGKILSSSEIAPRDHTKKILPMVDALLNQANLKLNEFDALAYGQGPGSFTGVRIGIGIAQGLAFGANLPMIGISTLKAMAQASFRLHQAKHVVCAIDARMSEIYWGQYAKNELGGWDLIPLSLKQHATDPTGEVVISPESLINMTESDKTHQWMCAGTGFETYPMMLEQLPMQLQKGSVLYPDAQDIAYLAQLALDKGDVHPASQATPIYLRNQVTWKKLPGKE